MNKLFTSILILCMAVATTAHAAQKTDVFTTKSGKTVTFTCIKHATIQIEYDGKYIYVDPVTTLKPETDFSQYPKANYILVTHEHRDHFDREAIALLRTATTTIYTNELADRLFHAGIVMKNGDVYKPTADISVEAVPAYNTTEGREQYHPKGRDNGYVLTLDGLRIYIAGDTEDIPEMAQLKDIDIAFLPCNQPYTMTLEQMLKAAEVIKPKVLFPYHYNDTPVFRALMMNKNKDIEIRIRDYK